MSNGPALVYADIVFPIHRTRSTVGRRNPSDAEVPTIDLALLDRERVVSRRHAELAWRDGIVFLVDVDARNGVFVNGTRLQSYAQEPLDDGDSISFGGVGLTFRERAPWPDGFVAEWESDGGEAEAIHTVASFSTLSGQLHQSVAHRELLLHYQPKVNLQTGALEAVECLVRWQHPTRGLLYPDTFLPLAESTGYVKAITGCVLDTALRQCAAWAADGLKLHVAVNISTRDLEDDAFPTRVAALLSEVQVDPTHLIIEVTETGVMSNAQQAIDTLKRLKSTGVKISIDDFGIGQSSLAYLQKLPADELKIDKSFVMDIDDGNMAILRSTIAVGHALGLRVIAEGVEDEGTVQILRDLGCDVGQGYFFGRPVRADVFFASDLAKGALAKAARSEDP
jgi:EAL domain-containing protein (putative c-di-GMP-specific phosphodiesterase class I)